MKRACEISIGLLCIYLIANLLTLIWITHHEFFPRFPETWANRLADWYGARNAEEVADLEGLVGGFYSPRPPLSFIRFSSERTEKGAIDVAGARLRLSVPRPFVEPQAGASLGDSRHQRYVVTGKRFLRDHTVDCRLFSATAGSPLARGA
ncbi:hypothetical protein [Burkholderia latens]|uniref:Uncharacterized protein n=1 Tax=Burkholderia latens TaxID=488446 RepID=A0A6H9SJN1_9BURK|nr:hypothetical protein [Burkholderia latens]KAB0632940.1 hypothetical protein F7R21_28640 [Burkholderia latens]VWB53551.1 hypothetical protein BLA24064_02445 [Burkholderia latens]